MFYIVIIGFLVATLGIPILIVVILGGTYSSFIMLIVWLLVAFVMDYFISNMIEMFIRIITKLDKQKKSIILSVSVSLLASYIAIYLIDAMINSIHLNVLIYIFLAIWNTMLLLFVDNALDDEGNLKYNKSPKDDQ